jgi:hypothetical protein
MLSLSKHGGQGLCARVFDRLRLTGLLFVISSLMSAKLQTKSPQLILIQPQPVFQVPHIFL